MNLREKFTDGSTLCVALWTILTGAAGFVLATLWPKTYEATATLLFPQPGNMNPQTGRALLPLAQAQQPGAYLYGGQVVIPTVGMSPNSVIDILESRAAAVAVAGKYADSLFGGPPDDYDLEEFSDAALFQVTENGSLRVAFRWSDRELCENVAADLIEFAEKRSEEAGREFAAESLEYLEDQVVRARREVDAKAENLLNSVRKSPEALAAAGRVEAISALVEASSRLNLVEAEFAAAQARLSATLGALRRAADNGDFGDAFTESAKTLQSQVADLKLKVERTSAQVTVGSPDLRRLQSELAATSEAYVAELERVARAAMEKRLPLTTSVETERAALSAQIAATRRALKEMRDEQMTMASAEVEQRGLARDLERAEGQLDFMVSQLEQARIAEDKKFRSFVVLDPPAASERPYFPRRGIFTLAGLGLGFLISMFYVVKKLGAEVEQQDGA